MKIENFEGTASTFTFPNAPNTYDDQIKTNFTTKNMPYQRHHIYVSGAGIDPKAIILTGFFYGTNKNANYQTLSAHFIETNKLKKLYFDTDKFHLGVGKEIKKTLTGGRTNMIDYVATFEPVVGVLFGDTLKEDTGSGAVSNAGNTTTYVEEIHGTITSGATAVTITDAFGTTITLQANTGSTGQTFALKFVSMADVGGGLSMTQYSYGTINGTATKRISTTGVGVLRIAAGDTTASLSVTNLSPVHINIRDGWSA